MTTAERIKELRLGRGMTMQQLADKCGVTKQSVNTWEKGTQGVSRQNLETLCDVFNVSMDYLMGGEDVTMRFLSSEELRLIDKLRAMLPAQQDLIYKMMEVERDKHPLDMGAGYIEKDHRKRKIVLKDADEYDAKAVMENGKPRIIITKRKPSERKRPQL